MYTYYNASWLISVGRRLLHAADSVVYWLAVIYTKYHTDTLTITALQRNVSDMRDACYSHAQGRERRGASRNQTGQLLLAVSEAKMGDKVVYMADNTNYCTVHRFEDALRSDRAC